jgi:pyrimidine-nucleoside phosphorylase
VTAGVGGSSDPRDVVARKRDGEALDPAEIHAFVRGYAEGEIADELAAAFLMAAYIRGLDGRETVALTRAYVASGDTVELDGIGRAIVDKHSTGGVADGVTLVFAPLAASVGLAVAKLSGRGLGHTGGTVDKLEAIPGFRTDLSSAELQRQVAAIGCAVAAQRPDIVPADAALYALRDATATVASLPLIAASVMAKKLAVASDLVLLDVKAGSGAFMKTAEGAMELAEACVAIGEECGRRVQATVTDMSQPLGHAIGNALEIAEAIALLSGDGASRLRELSVAFVGEALHRLEDVAEPEGRRRAERALESGAALERFREMVKAQGGDPRVADDPGAVLPIAPVREPVSIERGGVLASVDAEALGRAAAALGAGRRRKGDDIDPAVGVTFGPRIGDVLHGGNEVAVVHARTRDAARAAADTIRSAMTLDRELVEPPPLVLGRFPEGTERCGS